MVSILQNNIECICDALRDLVQFIEFNKREKHPWRSVNIFKIATLQKWHFSMGVFHAFYIVWLVPNCKKYPI